MSSTITFTQEEIDTAKDIVLKYRQEIDELDRLTLESDKIKDEISNIRKRLHDLEVREDDYLTSIRSKYGDVSIQQLSSIIFAETHQ